MPDEATGSFFLKVRRDLPYPALRALFETISLLDRAAHDLGNISCRQWIAGREHRLQVQPLGSRQAISGGFDGSHQSRPMTLFLGEQQLILRRRRGVRDYQSAAFLDHPVERDLLSLVARQFTPSRLGQALQRLPDLGAIGLRLDPATQAPEEPLHIGRATFPGGWAWSSADRRATAAGRRRRGESRRMRSISNRSTVVKT